MLMGPASTIGSTVGNDASRLSSSTCSTMSIGSGIMRSITSWVNSGKGANFVIFLFCSDSPPKFLSLRFPPFAVFFFCSIFLLALSMPYLKSPEVPLSLHKKP
eukprot:TRINITY_DN4540_c0_g1_i1.p1 TRINITY_DN4540_c0_g1~~TRINITY_DN4540_c0_g1_i1.p1  ORF type:complete len:103 (-),score=6.05 TRINITY_DN4540_c0_g1_i1:113-421(-)